MGLRVKVSKIDYFGLYQHIRIVYKIVNAPVPTITANSKDSKSKHMCHKVRVLSRKIYNPTSTSIRGWP